MNTANSKDFTERENLVCKVYPAKGYLIAGEKEVDYEVTDGYIRFYNLSELPALRLFYHYTIANFKVNTMLESDGKYSVYVTLK